LNSARQSMLGPVVRVEVKGRRMILGQTKSLILEPLSVGVRTNLF
jgi:hypothetical protein